MAKDTQKHLFFLSQSRKQIPKLERRVKGVTAQMDLMIKLSGLAILDGPTLLREANTCMKELIAIDNDLRKVIALAQGNMKKLPRDARLKAGHDFRSQVAPLERKHLVKAETSAKKLQKLAMKKSKEQRVSNASSDPFIVVLRVVQAVMVMIKYYRQQSKKI